MVIGSFTHPSSSPPRRGWGWVQSLNDLNQAYQNFFKSTKGTRKGKPVKPPRFKTRKSKQSARFTKGGFKVGQHKVYLAKVRLVPGRSL